MGWRSRWAVGVVIAGDLLGTGALPTVASGAAVRAQADTYVSAAAPRSTHGTDARLLAGRSPERRAYLRFRLPAGSIERATLRVFSLAAHQEGFNVRRIGSSGWSERRVTYRSMPEALGAAVRSRPLRRRAWTEVDVTPLVTYERRLAFALTARSRRAVVLASRERDRWAPRLVIARPEVPPPFVLPPTPPPTAVPAPADPTPLPTNTPEPEYLTQVAAPTEGSSDPTFFASNHRIAMTAAGRELVVYGRHGQGVQLAWRNPGGDWRSVPLLSGTGTGDWPASIAVAADTAGVEHAWVVWGREALVTNRPAPARPVQLVRLSGLDLPGGPTVGEPVEVDAGDLGGAVRPDIGFETGPDGPRGVLTWVRKVGNNTSELVAAWFTNVDTDTPAITGPEVLDGSVGPKGGTVVEAPDGARIVAFAGKERLSLFAHDPALTWQPAQEGAQIKGYPTATVLDDGEILAAGESATGVIVQRFPAAGAPEPELELTGYTTPTIATDGERAWLFAVRDGRVVSRERAPDSAWSGSDRVEIGPEYGGGYEFPNALRRVDDRLRLVVRGDPNGNQAAVLAYERPL